MTWLDESEERKRVLMDLNVMSIHKSPYIVKYYGSAIWNVSQCVGEGGGNFFAVV